MLPKDEIHKEGFTIFLNEKIGEGAQGCVYKCVQDSSMELLVAKVIDSPDIHILGEVENLRAVAGSSPYLLQYKDSFYYGDNLVIITEYCEKTMPVLLREFGGKLPETLAQFYFIQMMTGLQTLHEKQIIHRDIKPQ